jgi:hypothetical protein
LLFIIPFAFSQETITISTYYPAPFGVYEELRSRRMAIGDNYVDNTQFCWPPNNCANQIDAAADLVVEGIVGIGTSTPGFRSPGDPIPTIALDVQNPGPGLTPWGVRVVGEESVAANPGWGRAGVSLRDRGEDTQWSLSVFGSAVSPLDSSFGITLDRYNGGIPPGGPVKMVIDPDGNVGIGTNNPTGSGGISMVDKFGNVYSPDRIVDLQIQNRQFADDVQLRVGDLILNSRDSGSVNIEAMNEMGSNGNLGLGALGDIVLYTNNNTGVSHGPWKMVVKNNGNVGIGTDNPQAKLDVSGDIHAPQAKGLVTRKRFNFPFSGAHLTCSSPPADFTAYSACRAAYDERCGTLGYLGGASIDWDSTGMEGFCFRKDATYANE